MLKLLNEFWKSCGDFITGITSDSRNVKNGYIFVAIKGMKYNGEHYIDDAISLGASYIVLRKDSNYTHHGSNIIEIRVDNPRYALSYLSSLFYPMQPKNLVAVTGTNGKTSVSYFYAQICNLLGFKSGTIGTLGEIRFDKDTFFRNSTKLTAPDSVDLHMALDSMERSGYSYVSIEASSHGLHQHRLDNVKIKAAGFTNLTHDHLDYHGSTEAYFDAKMHLFNYILPKNNGTAILNSDDPKYDLICSKLCDCEILDYGKNAKFMRILSTDRFMLMEREYKINLNFLAEFQMYNLLCAIGLAISVGLNINEIMEIVNHLKQVPGRLELVATYNGANIYVDYAHTPDGLKLGLESLKKNKNKLYLVFGCGGDRDKDKRPIMGAIANTLADDVIVTDDNPRFEDPAKIRREIKCSKAIEIGDRYSAIKHAISNLKEGDVLLVAGKGHESYQIINDTILEFNDASVIKSIVKTLNESI